MTEVFAGSRVAVTGAAGGIGSALCEAFLSAGAAEVVALDRDPDRLAALEGDPRLTCRVLDVTDPGEVGAAFGEIGPLDVLVNNAGVTSLGRLEATPTDAISRVLEVNLWGSILCTRAGLEGLRQRRGRIGVMSSVAGFAPLRHRTAYAAAKHGLHGFFESLRMEEPEVSITLICPTFVASGIDRRAAFRAPGEDGAWSTTGRILQPGEVAALILVGLARRRALVLPTSTARAAYLVWRVSPGLYRSLARRRLG